MVYSFFKANVKYKLCKKENWLKEKAALKLIKIEIEESGEALNQVF